MRRKGGAGGRGRARAVHASNVEEELMRGIGVPQNTWGDGSCWLWAVAGALHKLEGDESPTDNDMRLEKEWRAAIQDTVKAHGLPMTDDDFRGLGEGVQYTHGRLTRGGTWGGGTEHQALAMILNVNIIIWDRRYIGRVGTQHRQLYVCTPQGDTFLKNIAHTLEWLEQSESATIHVLYDETAKHYKYFGKDNMEQETMDTHGPQAQGTETGKRKEEKEEGKMKEIKIQASRYTQVGEGATLKGDR
eukprot:7365-Pleurochrysis_carterae.AAC.1